MTRCHVRIGVLVLGMAAAGCSGDALTLPRRTAPLPAADEIPAEYQAAPLIFSATAEAGFLNDNTNAYATAWMRFFGNEARQTVRLTVRKAGAELAANSATSSDSHLVPYTGELASSAVVSIVDKCGLTAEANSEHYAAVKYKDLNVGDVTQSHYGQASQTACRTACETVSPTTFTNVSYDPYEAEEGDEDCTSGSGPGSGIQFDEGDYTGGETVNWETGIGDGGTSACGLAAKVEYICIDEWDADTGTWKRYSCGYATTC
jgi:hypothetical protein